jgi:GntR family transcriptional regulator
MPLPKYHQVYLQLRQQLEEGEHAAGLPGELALAGQFGVARVTVRRALQQLQAEGRVRREPGRGTVPTVAGAGPSPAAAAPGARLGGLLGNIVSMGLATQVRVLECRVLPAPAAVAQALQLAPGAPVQKARRVRSLREGPLSLITTHIPGDLAPRFDRRSLQRRPLLMLLQDSGVRIGSARQTVSARLADADAARHLDVQVGSALLSVTRLVHDDAGRPVQWLQGLYRPDRFEVEMELSQRGSVDATVWVSQDLTAPFQ